MTTIDALVDRTHDTGLFAHAQGVSPARPVPWPPRPPLEIP
ncbi:hypothetical protein [Streptomyces sp. NPDC059215]